MNLLHPWFLAGGVAVGLPLLIHWLTRPRPVRLPLSTIRFVRQAVQQRRARHKLRDILLLLLRALAVLLLVAAFVRPATGTKPLVQPESSAGAARVVLLDQSMGMGEVTGGATAFERARPIAARYLTDEGGARANLILAAAKPHAVVERLTANSSTLREALSSAAPLAQRLDAAAAINRAADLLSAVPPGQRRELVIVSNFQRTHWASVDFAPLPADTVIQLESVAPAIAPPNVAILGVTPLGRIEQGREARLNIDVGNYSSGPRDIDIAVTAGRISAHAKGLCPPGTKTTLSVSFVPPDAGWQEGQAALVNVEDGLAADNGRPFVLDVRPGATYALITREPATPRPTSSHFLELALAPFRPRGADAGVHIEQVRRIAPDALDRDALAGSDLIVLDHPGKLSAQQLGLLVALLRRGRPVLYVTAEPVDATNLSLLQQSAGADLKMPVQFSPPPAASARHGLFLTDVRRNVAPFRAFGESLSAAIDPLRFGGGLASHPLPTGLAEEVLAEYADHSACLVATPCAAGTLAVLNCDLNDSNLAGSPILVPLLDELVDRLLGSRAAERAAACGEPVAAYLPVEAGPAKGLKVAAPGGADESAGSIADDGTSVLWRWAAAGAPGVYSIRRDANVVFALASAPPAPASDLATLDASLLKSRLAGGRTVSVRQGDEDEGQNDHLWAWAMTAVAACLLLELLTLRVFKA